MSYWEHPIMQVKMILPQPAPMTELELAKDKMARWRDRHEDRLPEWVLEAVSLCLWYARDESHIDIMRDVIDDLDLSICFDTAHLLTRMSGTESIMDFYTTHRDRITEIHLQDATYTEYEDAESYDDHIPLGQGIMGDTVLRDFLSELVKDKFKGPLIFELSLDEARESLDYIRKVIPEVL